MYDFAVIGGGIVGLSTAWQLCRRQPDRRVIVLEKEDAVARHQTGRNSGVIHAGIYYEPGSLKAEFCKQGVAATVQFCRDNGIAFDQCGKLVVATDADEHTRLLALHRRAIENGIEVELLDRDRLRALEPNIRGVGAILSPATGIVDFAAVAGAMASRLVQLGGELRTGAEVSRITETAAGVTIEVAGGEPVQARFLVACAGLMADRIARMMAIDIDFRIVPYRGEYFQLPGNKNDLVSHLIYPVPDPRLPFLGVHLTPTIDGGLTVGPNAVQAWKREGYGRFSASFRDALEILSFPGFWRLTVKHLNTGLRELCDSLWKPHYLKRIRKYCPSITRGDLGPYPAGVRATAVTRAGTIVEDFLFAETSRSLHVCSAPSPAATSAIPIGEHLCNRILDKVAHGRTHDTSFGRQFPRDG